MRADARRNFDRILTAAREVILEQGIEASLEEIARRADVGIGTLYRHFPQREDLFTAVLHEAFSELRALAQKKQTDPDPVAALEEFLWFWLRNSALYKGCAAVVMASAIDGKPKPGTHKEKVIAASEALLHRAQQSGGIRSDVQAKDIWRLLGGLSLAIKDANLEPEQVRSMFDIVVRGIRT